MAGILYLVATPIGNSEDMTLRAMRVLKEVDLVVYEERKQGARILREKGGRTEQGSLSGGGD